MYQSSRWFCMPSEAKKLVITLHSTMLRTNTGTSGFRSTISNTVSITVPMFDHVQRLTPWSHEASARNVSLAREYQPSLSLILSHPASFLQSPTSIRPSLAFYQKQNRSCPPLLSYPRPSQLLSGSPPPSPRKAENLRAR